MIGSNVNVFCLIDSLSQVCESWRKLIISTPLLWQSVDLQTFSDANFPYNKLFELLEGNRLFDYLRALNLNGWSGMNAERILNRIAIRCEHNLLELSLKSCKNISSNFLQTLSTHCTNLQVLDISAITVLFCALLFTQSYAFHTFSNANNRPILYGIRWIEFLTVSPFFGPTLTASKTTQKIEGRLPYQQSESVRFDAISSVSRKVWPKVVVIESVGEYYAFISILYFIDYGIKPLPPFPLTIYNTIHWNNRNSVQTWNCWTYRMWNRYRELRP